MRGLVAAVIVAAAAAVAGCSASFSIGEPSSAPATSSMKKATASSSPEDTGDETTEDSPTESPAGGLTVDRNDLAQRVSDLLAEQVGRAPDAVTCPEDLAGEIGAETQCVLEDGGDRYGVQIVVTSVEGTNVGFDIAVDDQPS